MIKGAKHKNQLQLRKRQAFEKGLQLATGLKAKKITPERFAKSYAKLRETAIFESMTGFFTNYFFEVELKREISIARRYGTPLCLMVVDLDKLKQINDIYGHSVGNKAIVLLAKIVLQHIREEDIPCRWGGDEFTIILPFTDTNEALLVARRIKGLVDGSQIEIDKKRISISASIGIAKFSPLDSPNTLFKKADKAVYHVKETQRGEIAVYGSEVRKGLKNKLTLSY